MLISDRKVRLEIARGFLDAAKGGNVLVTSCRRDEGKTTVAVNIAYAVAEEVGSDVLLVDANLEAPALQRCFSLPDGPGFMDALAGIEVVGGTATDQLFRVMPIGTEQARAGGLVKAERSGHLDRFLGECRAKSQFVILDGSSIFGTVNPAPIAKACDCILLVVESEQTRWEVVQAARDQLQEAGANILGVVLNKRRYYIPRSMYG